MNLRSPKTALVYLRKAYKGLSDMPGWNTEHLGICYLAAALRQAGFPVTLIDGAVENLSSEEILSRLRLLAPDFVGFSVTFATIHDALHISKQLKAVTLDIHICLGGHHATLSAKQILENEHCINSIVRGDGEVTIVELLKALQEETSLQGIQGIYFRGKAGEVHENADRSVVANLDCLPFPARDTLELSLSKGALPSAMISTSRGCPWNCRHCSTPKYYDIQDGHYWRARSAINVVDEIQYLHDEYGCAIFNFIDDNAALPTSGSKERLYAIASEILRRGLKIHWFIMCNVLTFGSNDRELLSLLRTAGLTRILLGIEAGCRRTLKIYNKPAKPSQILAAIDLLSEYGFFLQCSFILFHPYATIEELKINAQFVKYLMDKTTVGVTAPYCTQLDVYPGIAIFEQVKRDGLLLSSNDYLDAHAYKYVSPPVGFLAKNMQNLLPHVVDIDWLAWETRLLLLRAGYSEESGDEGAPLGQVRKACESLVTEINLTHFNFFTLALKLAGQTDQLTFDREKANYLHQLGEQRLLLHQKYLELREHVPIPTNVPKLLK